ncbi:MAG TPA: 30S ribosome-binding factor RbfA [Verrucomicrobiae bacterium]|nr:30S ribosome-binding factor RbfA [Verrucomicrobiae bacterium]
MTVGGHRPERLAEEIHNEIDLMLAGELKDPRLAGSMVVTDVRLSPDMRTVRVFVRLFGTDAERAEELAGLKAASGYIRHELVERLQLRRAPDVYFEEDQSEEYGQHIEELLRKTKEREDR